MAAIRFTKENDWRLNIVTTATDTTAYTTTITPISLEAAPVDTTRAVRLEMSTRYATGLSSMPCVSYHQVSDAATMGMANRPGLAQVETLQ